MKNPVIIFGATGIARASLEIFSSNGILVYGMLDDDKSLHMQEFNGVQVLGNTDNPEFLKLIGKKTEAFVAIDDNRIRKSLVTMLIDKRKQMPVNAVHDKACIPESSFIGHGNFINAGVMIGVNTEIKNHCIIHSGAIIDHQVEINDFVQIGAGSIINSGTSIGEAAFIGSGVTIVSGVKIGKGARIGAGSVVIGDVKRGETLFGNPAKPVE